MSITHLVTGPLSVNTWFLPADPGRFIIVDPGGNPEQIITHARGREGVLSMILLTHAHFDHLAALPAIAEAFPEAEIAVHSTEVSWLGPGALARHLDFFEMIGAGNFVRKYGKELPKETRRLEDGDVIDGWTVLHTPGHSAGSVCLYSETLKTLVAGDTLFCGGIGRTDGPGGSDADMAASLKRLFALPGETLVLSGHGDRTTIAQERM